ncbi:MAG: hypothetical protein ABIZ70_16140 [Gemmatimonadales bacterium]
MSWKERLPAPAPFLAAWYLALILLGEGGFGGERTADALGTLVFATLTAAAAWLLSARLERGRATVLAVMLVAWFGLFGTARLILIPVLDPSFASPIGLLLLWVLPCAIGVSLLLWMPPIEPGLVRGLTTALVLLFAFSLFSLGRHFHPAFQAKHRAIAETRSANRPDIFILLLDDFGSPRSLERYYGVDLRWFTDSLKSLGFALPARARTNYIRTGYVLPTMLNWRLIHDELDTTEANPWPATARLTENAEAWTLLQHLGYRLAFYPTGFIGTLQNPHADILMRPPDPLSRRFGQTWLFNTPFDLWATQTCTGDLCGGHSNFPMAVEGPRALRWKLASLATLSDSVGPIVAFLHYLGSHEPFVFNRDCSSREPWWPRAENGADSLETRRAYAAQIECASHMVLATVTEIITKAKVPPIIVLQADHGNGSIRIDETYGRTVTEGDAAQWQLHDRLEPFAAYRFPHAATLVYDSLTPVNVLPMIFNSVLGTAIPYSADRSWWSTWQRPLDLTEVHWIGDSIAPVSPPATRRPKLKSVGALPTLPSGND